MSTEQQRRLEGVAKKPARKNAGIGNPAKRAAQAELDSRLTPADQRVLTEFSAWLGTQSEISAPSPELEVKGLNGLLASVRATGTNPVTPDAVAHLVDVALTKVEDAAEVEPQVGEQVAAACFGVLGDYLGFREDTDSDPAPWQRARLKAQQKLDDYFGNQSLAEDFLDQESALARHLDDAAAIAALDTDAAVRRDALLALSSMAGIKDLLAWIDDGRETDRAGEPREEDRSTVFAHLLPGATYTEEDLPLLTSWWDSLITSEVLDVAHGQVTAGPVTGWHSPTGTSVDTVEGVAHGFLAEAVSRITELHGRVEATELLAWTLAPALPSQEFTQAQARAAAADELKDMDDKAIQAVDAALAALVRLGFVTGDRNRPAVPATLRRTVAQGLRLAGVYTMLDEDDLFRDDPEG